MVNASAVASNQANNARGFRNLSRSQLGGVIFGCKNNTMRECLSKQLFGLPVQHFSYVKNIDPGLPLFLFNFSDRKLYGVYEAAGSGQMYIDQYAWTSDGSFKTQFPAQVQICVRLQCQPLLESQFKPLIMDNYFSQNHFWYELDHVQTGKLISKLSSLAYTPSSSPSQNSAKQRSIILGLPANDKREENECFKSQDLEDIFAYTSGLNGKLGARDTSLHSNGIQQPDDQAELGEKDLIYIKLKELALQREFSGGITNGPSEETTNAFVPPSINDAIIGQETLQEEQNVDCSYDSTGYPSVIAQLLQGIEELKAFKEEHIHKVDNLERKLAYAEQEITQLKYKCMMLESSNTVCARADEIMIDCNDDVHMKHESIFLTGGYDGVSWLSALDSYMPSLDVLKSLKPMNSVRAYASVAKLSGELYVFGGGTGSLWYDTVESYNPVDNKWTQCPSLKEKKGSLAGAALKDKIFVLGGGNGIECFSEVEMYDPEVGRWMNTQSMLQKRFALAAAESNGALYAVGGYDGSNYLATAERFDPREHSWTKIASMNTKRGCHALVALSGKLYAVGGYDGSTMVPSIEIYDPRLETWMIGEPMNHSRGYSAAAVLKESIYVIGGVQSNEEIVDVIECYKEGKGWQTPNLRAIGKRCFSSAIVLDEC
ncbi:PREDICTED: kelch-like protein 3 [Nicotiana attenuata]|uniref:B2 protein n=1 Tax=Nicotiana attenuata TaxID=49451 RepID=A0A1J6JAU4_NICAT|nr:PREDICTED: kelch-like protein 3 [Nicotiana attenuata]XP_019246121.1 PREDICTED: kelch-like protein 3 [Nicotiana attenuata]XP_019246130.1 PREDICTED: kelch-like protein 3 [Nicotiana attenuata]OIT07955.1 b2 protein [Nicotiana attenuata]